MEHEEHMMSDKEMNPMKPKLGTGGRFKMMVGKLKGKVANPAAVAASIGRKKYGKKKFQALAAKARAAY